VTSHAGARVPTRSSSSPVCGAARRIHPPPPTTTKNPPVRVLLTRSRKAARDHGDWGGRAYAAQVATNELEGGDGGGWQKEVLGDGISRRENVKSGALFKNFAEVGKRRQTFSPGSAARRLSLP
jgi:hypothetical protein